MGAVLKEEEYFSIPESQLIFEVFFNNQPVDNNAAIRGAMHSHHSHLINRMLLQSVFHM